MSRTNTSGYAEASNIPLAEFRQYVDAEVSEQRISREEAILRLFEHFIQPGRTPSELVKELTGRDKEMARVLINWAKALMELDIDKLRAYAGATDDETPRDALLAQILAKDVNIQVETAVSVMRIAANDP